MRRRTERYSATVPPSAAQGHRNSGRFLTRCLRAAPACPAASPPQEEPAAPQLTAYHPRRPSSGSTRWLQLAGEESSGTWPCTSSRSPPPSRSWWLSSCSVERRSRCPPCRWVTVAKTAAIDCCSCLSNRRSHRRRALPVPSSAPCAAINNEGLPRGFGSKDYQGKSNTCEPERLVVVCALPVPAQHLLNWMWAEDTTNCQSLLTQNQHDSQKRKLKNCMPFWRGSRPGVWTRYPLEVAGFETTAGATEAVSFDTNLCNTLAGQFSTTSRSFY